MTWTPEQLTALGSADEIEISSRREDGTLRPFVTIWAVRAGDDIIVRSAHGTGNGWDKRALASVKGAIKAGGVEADVVFEPVTGGHDQIDAVYHDKYDKYGSRVVNPVVSAESHAATLRLVPTP
ncbi:DUF2255 family protein [soil metagenome]